MKEFNKELIGLKIYGQEVSVSRPTWGQLKKFKAESKESIKDTGDDLPVVEKLFIESGVPQDLLDQMDIHHIKALQEILLEPKKN